MSICHSASPVTTVSHFSCFLHRYKHIILFFVYLKGSISYTDFYTFSLNKYRLSAAFPQWCTGSYKPRGLFNPTPLMDWEVISSIFCPKGAAARGLIIVLWD